MGNIIHRCIVLAGASMIAWGCARRPEPVAISLDEGQISRITQAVRVSSGFPAQGRFVSVARAEPDKSAMKDAPAKAIAIVYAPELHGVHELVVDVESGEVGRMTAIPGAQPQIAEDEFEIASELARGDSRWQEAVRKRGITDFEQVLVDGWAPGERAPGGVPDGTRMMRMLSYDTANLRDPINPYSQPIEGVEVLVDLDRRRVVDVIDHGVVPRKSDAKHARAEAAIALKPLRTVQPQGASFRIDGDALAWGHWRLRIEFHPRDGLILRDIGWADGGGDGESARVRPILASAALSEMVVPYGDPAGSWRWRSAFDSGEYGLGNSARSLTPGVEVPEHATVLGACVVTSDGEPKPIPGAVGIYERDGGLGWLHYDYLSERVESARARELCITSIVTIGNYDYGVTWILREDGSIQVDAMLTGILLPKGTAAQVCSACEAAASGTGGVGGEGVGDERYGTLIAPGVVAPNHQHWFSFRLDFDIDGIGNSVLEMNTRSAGAGPENPAGNAFIMSESLLKTEREAKRNLSVADHRLWRIVNPSVRNGLGHLSGYELVPGGNGVPYATEGSPLLHDAGFVKHHVWITRQNPAELHAAGDYPNQTRGGEGLPVWAGDEPIVNTDVVVWYCFAVTHTPRAEEWPVMSTERSGFRLLPKGFFERNPAYQAR